MSTVGAARSLVATVQPLLPWRGDHRGLRRSWARDLAAGVTVGIVALPLALAFGVATGVGAAPGLITAVVAGAVAAVFGGSHLQVSGPTGAMTVVLVPLVAQHGRSVVYPVAVLAGIVVVAAAVLGLGRLLAYVPWPLVEGFTVGIAVIIAAQQVPGALGVPRPDVENAAAAAVAVGRFAQHPRWTVLGLLALSIVLSAALPRLHRALPASLLAVVAVVAVTVLAETVHLQVTRIGALPSSLPVPAMPDLADVGSLVAPALVVAFLAALESLLSARVADGMSDAPRHDPDRELFGQGLANIASGLVGRIPLVALAGVLMVTAYRMVERHNVHAVLRSTRTDVLVFTLTAVATVAFDLVTAVGAGLVLAAVLTLVRLARTAQATVEPLRGDGTDDDAEHALLSAHVLVYRLDGPLFFASAARFLAELTAISDVRVIILRLSGMAMLDATGARALGEIVEQLAERDITVLIKGASPEHARLLAAVGTLAPLLARDHVFTTLADAVAHARQHVARTERAGSDHNSGAAVDG